MRKDIQRSADEGLLNHARNRFGKGNMTFGLHEA